MPTCCVPLCKSGYASQAKKLKAEGLPPKHFFKPKNEEQRARWATIIKRQDTPLTLESRVCSDHFTSDKIDLFFETKLPDGTIHRIPRDKATLKPNADPSIFTAYPEYYQPSHSKRKSPKKRETPKHVPINNSKSQLVENVVDVEEELIEPPIPNREPEVVDVSQETEKIWPYSDIRNLTLSQGWKVHDVLQSDEVSLVHVTDNLEVDKSITFKGTEKPSIKIRGRLFDLPVTENIRDISTAKTILGQISVLKLCAGTGIEKKKFSTVCRGGVSNHAKRCPECHAEMKRLKGIEERKQKVKERLKKTVIKRKSQTQNLRRSKANLLAKIAKCKKKMHQDHMECLKKDRQVVLEAINKLPSKAQQEAVKACFDAAERKGPSGRRYTAEWVYECLLMRIKDKKLYEHIRAHEILVLPCASTMRKYLKHYGGTFGFQPQTLELMKEKAAEMQPRKRRGMLLIDEMHLTKGVYFDASVLKVRGFKDMGEENYESFGDDFKDEVDVALEKLPVDPKAGQKAKRRAKKAEQDKKNREKNLGDHALTISFQPFMGTWVQPVGCFLTRGNASDAELTQLVLEAVILLEKSGYFVDGVVTDGASWNRAMWKKFGVTADHPRANHPCDEERNLWFISDFPHLMKCMRNCLSTKKIIQTPDGDVKLEHWEAVQQADALRQVGMRMCYRLTPDHIHPNPWQKMNVRMAWQFWSNSCAAAMEVYRNLDYAKLQGCEGSIKMCKLINNLADTMNSNRPQTAVNKDSPQLKAIDDFLEYFISLKDWANKKLQEKLQLAEKNRVQLLRAQGKNPRGKSQNVIQAQEDYIFSDSTDIGLIVSLKAAKELIAYLLEKCDFRYVMTARFNQDALERFFGLVRQSCGGNTHPEPRVFAQLFRLLSIYALVKPVRGSNITGGQMVTTLLNLEDLNSKTRKERKDALSQKLDEIIINGENLEDIPELMDHVDHDYIGESVDEFALSYVGGFVARHARKYCQSCDVCLNSLCKSKDEATDVDALITLKSKGYLTYPSDALIRLLHQLEEKIISTSLHNELEENILFVVLEKLENVKVDCIGCDLHKAELTKSIMKFFLITRMHFLTRRWNERTVDDRKKQKGHRKQAHLT